MLWQSSLPWETSLGKKSLIGRVPFNPNSPTNISISKLWEYKFSWGNTCEWGKQLPHHYSRLSYRPLFLDSTCEGRVSAGGFWDGDTCSAFEKHAVSVHPWVCGCCMEVEKGTRPLTCARPGTLAVTGLGWQIGNERLYVVRLRHSTGPLGEMWCRIMRGLKLLMWRWFMETIRPDYLSHCVHNVDKDSQG